MEITEFLENTYKNELKNQDTRYFILDTTGKKHKDIDFVEYAYRKEKYNLLRENDLFIYRRPQKFSDNQQFYFFGCGRIKKLDFSKLETGQTQIIAQIDKPVVFDEWIFQNDLIDYRWEWKEKKNNSFLQFFNNYGMNRIPKEDFLYLINLGVTEAKENTETNEAEVKFIKQIQIEHYKVPDKYTNTKTRGAAQKIFSNKLKEIYNGECCITGIRTKGLLVGSHIIPWSKNEDIRLDPQNGLLLSVLVDKLFDLGLIFIDNDYKVLFQEKIKKDEFLYQEIKKFEGRKIKLPERKYRPNTEFLKFHRNMHLNIHQ